MYAAPARKWNVGIMTCRHNVGQLLATCIDIHRNLMVVCQVFMYYESGRQERRELSERRQERRFSCVSEAREEGVLCFPEPLNPNSPLGGES